MRDNVYVLWHYESLSSLLTGTSLTDHLGIIDPRDRHSPYNVQQSHTTFVKRDVCCPCEMVYSLFNVPQPDKSKTNN